MLKRNNSSEKSCFRLIRHWLPKSHYSRSKSINYPFISKLPIPVPFLLFLYVLIFQISHTDCLLSSFMALIFIFAVVHPSLVFLLVMWHLWSHWNHWHTPGGCFTTHPHPNSNFTLEKGSNHNMLSMHFKIQRLSNDTVENIKDSLGSFDVCDPLLCVSDPLVG